MMWSKFHEGEVITILSECREYYMVDLNVQIQCEFNVPGICFIHI